MTEKRRFLDPALGRTRSLGRVLVGVLAIGVGTAATIAPAVALSAQPSTTATRPPLVPLPGPASTTTAALDPIHDRPKPGRGPVGIIEGAPINGLSVVWIALSPTDPNRVRVAINDPGFFADPAVSVVVSAGIPGGARGQVTAGLKDGNMAGTAVKIEGSSSTPLADPGAGLIATGIIELALPDGGTLGADAMVWAETQRTAGDVTSRLPSPAFNLSDLRGQGSPGLRASQWALLRTADPPKLVKLGVGPTLQITDSMLVFTFPGAQPTDLDGKKIVYATDLIEIRLGGPSDIQPSADILIGEGSHVPSVHKAGSKDNVPVVGTTVSANGVDTVSVSRKQVEDVLGRPLTTAAMVGLTRRFQFEDQALLDVDGVHAPVVANAVAGTSADGGASAGDPTGSDSAAASKRSSTRRVVFLVVVGGGLLVVSMFLLWFRTTDNWRRWKRAIASRGDLDGGVRRPPPGTSTGAAPSEDPEPEDPQSSA